jgi:AbrB family looped-hinge helix DNA binding protein
MHHKRLYGTATVGTKGQIVIPADAREELDIKPGDRLYVIGSPKASAVMFIKEEQLESFIEKININIENFKTHKSFNKKEKD